MEIEKLLGLVVLAWLIGSVLLMAGLVRRGRMLTDVLAQRYPETYEALGRPQPGFLHSSRRRRFALFISSRGYDDLGDRELSARFEKYRRAEARLLVFVLVSLLVVALMVFAVRNMA